MIFSKFGSRLTPVSKSEDGSGRVWVQATAEGSPDIREYAASDLKADEGLGEINRAIAQLPPKVVGSMVERRRQTLT
ncbi:MAG TPA: hypothetical protein VFB66_29535 [Tepidisphaeraceae bacterium]|nr:hypothetical protein [Tepidisphaeraceae bacterium]